MWENDEDSALMDENRTLKHKLAELEEYIERLMDTNRRLIKENRRIADAEADGALLRKELKGMRSLMDKLPAEEKIYHMRIEILQERLRELQQENFELRRQIAGLTPERIKMQLGEKEPSSCHRCLSLAKQKALQNKYMVAQASENRVEFEELRNKYMTLKDSKEKLEIEKMEMETQYKKELKTALDQRDLYRRWQERSAKWHKTQLEGFNADISKLKSQVTDLEKHLIMIDCNTKIDRQQQAVIDQLKKLTSDALAISNRVKQWRNVYE